VSVPSTVERATYAIRRLIVEDGLGPGDRLPSERDLARLIGASRASLRQAIARLAASGVIQIRKNSGTFVSTRNDQPALEGLKLWLTEHNLSLEELVQFRQAVEPVAASAAALKRSAEDLEEMRAEVEAMRRATAEADHQAYSRADRRFHALVARASDNRLFSLVLESMGPALDMYLSATARLGPAMLARSIEDHAGILRAIEAGDAAAAERAAIHHTRQTVIDFKIIAAPGR
jgi:GntR family transcriptional repressor for pyruvate dehydrogenase complex